MWYAKPDDGWAYSKVELGAIDDLPHTEDEATDYRLKRWHYFRKVGDEATMLLLERAILAEFKQDPPAWAEVWDDELDDLEDTA